MDRKKLEEEIKQIMTRGSDKVDGVSTDVAINRLNALHRLFIITLNDFNNETAFYNKLLFALTAILTLLTLILLFKP